MREHVGVKPQRRYVVLAGAVAGLSGIAVSHAATNALNARATPIQAVAEVIIAKTPGGIAEALIQVVGRKDKPILVAGITLGIIALGALAGVLALRSRLVANLVFLGMGAVALAALMSRPGFTATSIIPLAAGVVSWLVVLAFLVDAAPVVATAAPPGDGAPAAPAGAAGVVATESGTDTRRGFLIKAGVVAAGSLAVAASERLFGRSRRAVETSRRLLRLPVGRGAVPADAELGLGQLTPWRVPNDAFYRIDTALVLPAIDPNEWRLRLHGMVDREITLTFQDLLARRLTQAWVTLCCVSNPVGGDLIGNAFWSGVRVADLLAEAGVSPDADAVRQTSQDGWTCGTPIEALTDDRNAMLAIAMNGDPLPVDHGFPVRMVVPGLYGFVSATKWVVDLEVTRFDAFTAYWTGRGWSAQGPVKTESKIEAPGDGSEVQAGPMRVGGYAWAQHTGIEAVEVRLDGNAWMPAELGGVPGNDTWVQWAATLDVPAGEHTLAVRATDKSGYTQTAARADVLPDGATGWHTIGFTAA
jgi:DMSO/TMAO reductase YedYZ molybdopterin-dependent catalytic subunit